MTIEIFNSLPQNALEHSIIYLYEGLECTLINGRLIDKDTLEDLGDISKWILEIAIIKNKNNTILWEDFQ